VTCADIDEAGSAETARLIADAGGSALPVTCGVTQDSDVEAAVKATISEFGRLDAAFNNAGIEQPVATVAQLSIAEFDRLIAVTSGLFSYA
jgi:NAD(P)-dependent dehydrogenase (short-subunit alcohol dehydrogenase family)